MAKLEALPENRNVFELYRRFSKSVAETFSALGILDMHKSRGAFASYWGSIETDLKAVSASGWYAELIPEDEILQSQYPEVLDELARNEAKRDELESLFAEVNELEESDPDGFRDNEQDYDVFPKVLLKEVKGDLKEINGNIRGLKKDIRALEIRVKANYGDVDILAQLDNAKMQLNSMLKQKETIDNKLAKHTHREKELKQSKATIKEIKDKKEELVEKAREKITTGEAKVLILKRWKETLEITVMDYVNRYERELVSALEQRFVKYKDTLTTILEERDAAADKLSAYLKELGYE